MRTRDVTQKSLLFQKLVSCFHMESWETPSHVYDHFPNNVNELLCFQAIDFLIAGRFQVGRLLCPSSTAAEKFYILRHFRFQTRFSKTLKAYDIIPAYNVARKAPMHLPVMCELSSF